MRIRLPDGMSITLDMVFVFVITLPIFRFTLALVLGLILGLNNNIMLWLYAAVCSGSFAVMSRKFEPAGKSIMQFVYDITMYCFRSHWSDGWNAKSVDLYKGNGFRIGISYVSGNECGVFPAEGNVNSFELKTPAAVRIVGKKILITGHGRKMPIGSYVVKDGKIQLDLEKPISRKPQLQPPVLSRPPVLKRKGVEKRK